MASSAQGFPAHPHELDAVWLTEALRDAGRLDRGRVRTLRLDRIAEGIGFLGELVRIHPEYDGEATRAPRTLIAKFAAADAQARSLAGAFGVYRCEVNFYRYVAPKATIHTPRCYFAGISDNGADFVLLLEDLSATGDVGDQLAGCTLPQAQLALRHLARFHASWWASPDLEALDWMPLGLDLARRSFSFIYPAGWKTGIERYGHLVPPAVRDAAPVLDKRILGALDEFDEAPKTIAHTDYRLDNMFFGRPGSDYELTVIDWQITNRGYAAFDVAYFIAGSLDVETRRRCQDDLLRTYHDALSAADVRDYAFDALYLDYRRTMLIMLANQIGAVATLNTANARGVALFEALFQRASAAVTDLDSLELLPPL